MDLVFLLEEWERMVLDEFTGVRDLFRRRAKLSELLTKILTEMTKWHILYYTKDQLTKDEEERILSAVSLRILMNMNTFLKIFATFYIKLCLHYALTLAFYTTEPEDVVDCLKYGKFDANRGIGKMIKEVMESDEGVQSS